MNVTHLHPFDADGAIHETAARAERAVSRRGLLGGAGLAAVGSLLGAGTAFGAGFGPADRSILNFALTLEYLEAAFYKMGNEASGLIPSDYQPLFRTIGKHETAHVALLKAALGSAAVAAPKVDFTAGGKYADVFSNFKTFATLSATFEDLGVAAYKGQAGNLAGTPVLTTALQIHSVEARHAAAVRPLIRKASAPTAFDKPLSKAKVLAAAKPFLA